MPQKAVAAPGAEVADAEVRNAAKAFHLLPKLGLGAGVEDIELKLAEAFEAGPGFQLVDGRKGVDLPQCGLGPEAVEAERELAVFDGELEVGEAEVLRQPLKESGLKDAALSIKGIARQPDELGLVKPELPGLLKLLAELGDVDGFAQAHRGGPVHQRKRHTRARKVLPDELEHQQLIEICIKQGAGNGVKLPVMIVRAPGDIDYHGFISLLDG